MAVNAGDPVYALLLRLRDAVRDQYGVTAIRVKIDVREDKRDRICLPIPSEHFTTTRPPAAASSTKRPGGGSSGN